MQYQITKEPGATDKPHKIMNANTYKELSNTAEGRQNAHNIMLDDVNKRIEKFVNAAPESNRERAAQLMKVAFENISKLGNGQLFNFFANDQISDNNFMAYLNDILTGKFNSK